jgi:hypothetical protein
LDGESRGVRPLGCMRSHLCKRRRPGHGGDTKPTARARRRHRDKSTTSRFRRGGVQGQGGQKGSNLGSMARRTHVRRCVRVRGDGTTGCQAQSQTGEAGLGPSVACVRVCAERRRHGHGGDTKLMACTRQGNEERGIGEERPDGVGCGAYAGERPRVCVSARAQVRPGRTGPRPGGGVCGQNVGGTAMVMAQRRRQAHDKGLCSHDSWPKKGKALARRWRAQHAGAGGKPKLGDSRRNKERHHCKAKERARRRRQRHLQSDWLGSMAGSQATAGLRGGAVRDSGPRTAQVKPRAWPSFLFSARRPNSTARRETRCSPRVQGCGGEVVLKRSGKMDAEQGQWRTGWSRGRRGWFGSFLPQTVLAWAPASLARAAPASQRPRTGGRR